MQQYPIVLDDAAIQGLLDKLDVRSLLERMFRSLGEGTAKQPPQTLSLFPNDTGDFITYLGVLADEKVFGAKLSPYIANGGNALVTAWTVLMSSETGTPLLLCDSKRLTTERTAAATALAVDHLARDNSKTLTIIGTGAVGQAHLRYVETLRNWKEVRLYSHQAAEQPELPKQLKSGAGVRIAASAEEAIRDADVVLLCTSSGTPVIDVKHLRKDALVTSISTNVANAHEIDPGALGDFDVYCDYRETTPQSAGEMKIAAAMGEWSADRIRGDLPELITGRAEKPTYERPAFFRSIGLGLEDIAAAVAVLAAIKQNQI
ncbi:ornithine cyclodeaminase family protein [Brucella pituitosa]|uniref:ornithine cyclodeaminase family protein n=1 Tax=Brucella pituitosa TaxID=571256 RepID=UPI000F5D55B8|nr:ornithine cyclodeaminase family protein [Brucellaceae bacterium VT-16-1752]